MHRMNALLVIDMQVNQFAPEYPVAGGPELIERIRALIARAREAHLPVVFVRNCGGEGEPDVRGTHGWQLHPEIQPQPGDLVLDKTTCDTFETTRLREELATRGVAAVTICGLQSDFCVRETTLGALKHGLQVTLVEDGHSTCAGKTRTAEQATAAVNLELADRVELVRAAEIRFEM